MPDVGDIAPVFSLAATSGVVNIPADASGKKLVIAFYVEDRTPG